MKTVTCSVAGCDRGGRIVLGYCSRHYGSFKRHGDPLKVAVYVPGGAQCAFPGCDRKAASRGMCEKHRPLVEDKVELVCAHCKKPFVAPAKQKKRKFCGHGCVMHFHRAALLAGSASTEAVAARAAKADALRGTGRPDVYVKRHGRHEHRVVVERAIGRLLTSKEVVHHINGDKHDNSLANLQIMTHAEHAREHFTGAKRPKKTHCKNGHEFTQENTFLGSRGERRCLSCSRRYGKEWQKAKRVKRGPLPQRTHCADGHELAPSNTYTDKKGHRHCRACLRVGYRKYRARKKEKLECA